MKVRCLNCDQTFEIEGCDHCGMPFKERIIHFCYNGGGKHFDDANCFEAEVGRKPVENETTWIEAID